MSITSQTDREDKGEFNITCCNYIYLTVYLYFIHLYYFLKVSLSATKHLSNLVCIALD